MRRTSALYVDLLPGTLPILIALAGLGLLAGCVQTSMLPAQQFDGGETALSASLHVPPRYYDTATELSGQFTAGLGGGGDLSLNVSASEAFVTVGVAPRMYLTDRLTLQGQFRAANLSDDARRLAVAGLQSVPSGENPFYVGAYGGALEETGPLVGARVGATFDLGSSTTLQIEGDGSYSPGEGGESDIPGRISIGIFRLFD